MSNAHAPYGFVPVNEQVFLPDWGGVASQDWPFEDGLCGTLTLEIACHTPIFVRGTGDSKAFFQGPDGRPAIPGSSLRGALRSVIEAASFGWLRRVNDHRYGVRDLHNQKLYVQHMAAILEGPDGKPTPMPKVIAGWLRRGPDVAGVGEPGDVVAEITPCHFAKVHYRDLIAMADKSRIRYNPGDRQSSVRKYASWGVRAGGDLERLRQRLPVTPIRPRTSVGLPFDFGVVRSDGGKQEEGTLVFTGQPSRWDPREAPRRGGGHPKQHDFFFYGDGPSALPVTRDVMEGFEFVHGDGQQQHSRNKRRQRNEEWDFWGEAYDAGKPVPVFFLLHPAKGGARPVIRAFGLAMMFRLPYDRSIGQAVRASQRMLGLDPRPDLAETLFGHVPMARRGRGADREATLKGRVSVGLATLVTGAPATQVTTVLGAPKASFYPAYVEQNPDAPGSNPSGAYVTWMDESARVRGFKRYRPQPTVVSGPPLPRRQDGTTNTQVGVTFAPLAAGAVFRAQVRVHNVRLCELGALLWALDFGGAEGCFHTLGMARSLGYGRATLRVSEGPSGLRLNAGGPVDGAILDAARAAFVDEMERFCSAAAVAGGWLGSRRIYELREMARPLAEQSPHRWHMQIAAVDPRQRERKVNEFNEVKRAGHALPSAGTVEGWVAYAGGLGRIVRAPVGAWRPAQSGAPTGAPPRSAPVVALPIGGPGWRAIRGGTVVEGELLGTNKKGKWVAKLVGPDAQDVTASGTVSTGEPPGDVQKGARVRLVVTAGGDPKNLGLKWP